ncbi:NAD(P)/FAD-dependent oxidoreductase [Candidatus Solincola tengchongensis]|uniref:phytoene desaturase family protein n=1 Tax=Candidatus Solincola tengchongensis TaxID=2900693 RepID=UPI00257ED597|nr:NAD(P)/FAD-dependent oxidoreductase [Candidatus Solincola tengchongensis]
MKPDRDWDVIVVGAGLGGLTAAACLLREGLRVLVVDASSHPGGTAYVYRRGRFLFPMGPLGCAHPGLVHEILHRAGLETPPVFRRVHYGLHAFGMSLTLSHPFPETAQRLSRSFPHEEAAIRKFFQDMEFIAARLPVHLLEAPESASPESGTCDDPRLPPHSGSEREGKRNCGQAHHRKPGSFSESHPPSPAASAASYLEELVKDRRLRRILGSMGTREPYSNLALLSSMWFLLCESGIHYPEGGFHGLSDALAALSGREPTHKRLKNMEVMVGDEVPRVESGQIPAPEPTARKGGSAADKTRGMLLLGRRVSRILLGAGRAEGVVLEDGAFLRASAVISNVDFKNTFLNLIGPEEIHPSFLDRLASAPLTSSNLQICLGLDSRRVDLSAFDENSRIIYRRQTEGSGHEGVEIRPDTRFPDPGLFAEQELELCLLSADDTALAPEDRAVLVIRTAAPHDPFLSFRDRPGRRTPAYRQYKALLGEALVREAASLLPGLGDSVEVMDVATPLTFEERAGRTGGAVAGWSWRYGKNSGSPVELVRTPVAGLFMAGHQAFSMLALGGVPSSLLSGLRAAECVLADAPPLEDMELPSAPGGPWDRG